MLKRPAAASAHRVVAVGHAHIDSAWLWPVREKVRKCIRTFSNVLALMDEHPGLVFAASSAQQYAWVRDHAPDLFERIRARVGEGRFVPVGGMWVESDTNMPGGEAMARQFVAGKRFFIEELGVEPLEAWLPDSFGYSAALPQIVRAAGSRYFLTQKISWNETNVMPHHKFRWEGIDGTRVFTHFPPVDTFRAVGEQAMRTAVRLRGMDPARARQEAEALAARVGLAEGQLERPVHALSGGELQRVAQDPALQANTRRLVCDEITSGLDMVTRQQIMTLLDSLRQEGLALLLITHELAVAERLAHRFVEIVAGRLADVPQRLTPV